MDKSKHDKTTEKTGYKYTKNNCKFFLCKAKENSVVVTNSTIRKKV